jgi:hypothetical protein
VIELSLTTAVCKSLYENNVTLKSKHKALLAVLPSTPATPIEFPSLPVSPSSQTPPNYIVSLPPSAANSLGPAFQPPAHLRRTRKISVSPADIALLSDQNAELLQKLERLENESAQADQVGRRALKRLEKEIQSLREELEKTQAKSEELEEKTRAGFDKGAEKVIEEAWRRKKEREAKLKALRKKGERFSGEDHVRDFAPGSHLPGLSDRTSTPRQLRRGDVLSPQETGSNASLSSVAFHTFGSSDSNAQLYDSPQDDHTPTFLAPPPESAVLTQLLSKIQELEETNAQIKDQQTETLVKLQSVQRETEHISKLYECLGDPADVEWVVDAEEEEEQQQKEDDTIRFQSLRRTLERDSFRPFVPASDDSDVFRDDNVQSTLHGDLPPSFTAHRARKSVVGLFDAGGRDEGTANAPNLGVLSESDRSSQAWSNEIASPILSELGLTSPLHTLGSELGSEFGDDLGGDHHLRTGSLAELVDGAESPIPTYGDDSGCSQTPVNTRKTGLQFTVEKPTPEQEMGNGQQAGEQRTRHSSRYLRMSQTINLRTNRWVDGRFEDSLVGSNDGSAILLPDAGRPTEMEPVAQRKNEVELLRSSGVKKEKKALVKFVVEVWLWLQFAVVVFVFLWAVARQGPKGVLKDAERRRRGKGKTGV